MKRPYSLYLVIALQCAIFAGLAAIFISIEDDSAQRQDIRAQILSEQIAIRDQLAALADSRPPALPAACDWQPGYKSFYCSQRHPGQASTPTQARTAARTAALEAVRTLNPCSNINGFYEHDHSFADEHLSGSIYFHTASIATIHCAKL